MNLSIGTYILHTFTVFLSCRLQVFNKAKYILLALIYDPALSVWVITKSNRSENPRGFNIKFKIKIMKKQIENFIVKCVCKGIEMYVSQHRFGFNGMLEMLPLTNEDFKKHLSKQLTEEAAKSYLETVPTIHPQDVQ